MFNFGYLICVCIPPPPPTIRYESLQGESPLICISREMPAVDSHFTWPVISASRGTRGFCCLLFWERTAHHWTIISFDSNRFWEKNSTRYVDFWGKFPASKLSRNCYTLRLNNTSKTWVLGVCRVGGGGALTRKSFRSLETKCWVLGCPGTHDNISHRNPQKVFLYPLRFWEIWHSKGIEFPYL